MQSRSERKVCESGSWVPGKTDGECRSEGCMPGLAVARQLAADASVDRDSRAYLVSCADASIPLDRLIGPKWFLGVHLCRKQHRAKRQRAIDGNAAQPAGQLAVRACVDGAFRDRYWCRRGLAHGVLPV